MKEKYTLAVFDNPNVLRQLIKTWEVYSNFRVDCLTFPDSEMFLSIMTTFDSIQNSATKELCNLQDLHNSLEIHAFKLFWENEFNYTTVSKIITLIEEKEIKVQKSFDLLLFSIHNLNIDGISKIVIFQKMIPPYLENVKNANRASRLLFIFASKHFGLFTFPALYPDDFMETKLDTAFTEESIIRSIQFFENICVSGSKALKNFEKYLTTVKEKINEVDDLKKLSKSPFFNLLFTKTHIKISDLMEILNWKRDKAARILSRLTKCGFLAEQKVGKKKIFYNQMLFSLINTKNKN